MEQMVWGLITNVLSVPYFHGSDSNDSQFKYNIVTGRFMLYSFLKIITISQNQKVTEGDFSIDFLLVSERNIPVKEAQCHLF